MKHASLIKFYNKTYVYGNGVFREDRRDASDNKITRNYVVRERINIKNWALDYIRYKQLNCYGYERRIKMKKSYLEKF